MNRAALCYVLAGVMLNAIAQLFLKAAATRLGPLTLQASGMPELLVRIAAQPRIWYGLTCYGVSVLLWIVALSRVPVSLAYPFLSLGYVVTALAAWQLFGEHLSAQRIAAIALICAGVALLYRS
jgi:multidrug transporter EmrE-like cation transporter